VRRAQQVGVPRIRIHLADGDAEGLSTGFLGVSAL
jgi:hypothetical protein